MIYDYIPEEKNQPGNPFYKILPRDKAALIKELEDRLLWLCQLGASKDKLDQQVYELVFNVPDRKEFGAAPHYGNQANTGAAALAGAIGKLRTGDLSQKQINNIMPVLEVLHKAYPRTWSAIEFRHRETVDVKVKFESIFEFA